MSLSKSKCWYSNDCLHFSKCAVPFLPLVIKNLVKPKVGDKHELLFNKPALVCSTYQQPIIQRNFIANLLTLYGNVDNFSAMGNIVCSLASDWFQILKI